MAGTALDLSDPAYENMITLPRTPNEAIACDASQRAVAASRPRSRSRAHSLGVITAANA